MTEPDATRQLIDLIQTRIPIGEGTVLEGSEGIEEMAALLDWAAHRDFVTIMVGKDGVPLEWSGVDGFREALGEWIMTVTCGPER